MYSAYNQNYHSVRYTENQLFSHILASLFLFENVKNFEGLNKEITPSWQEFKEMSRWSFFMNAIPKNVIREIIKENDFKNPGFGW